MLNERSSSQMYYSLYKVEISSSHSYNCSQRPPSSFKLPRSTKLIGYCVLCNTPFLPSTQQCIYYQQAKTAELGTLTRFATPNPPIGLIDEDFHVLYRKQGSARSEGASTVPNTGFPNAYRCNSIRVFVRMLSGAA